MSGRRTAGRASSPARRKRRRSKAAAGRGRAGARPGTRARRRGKGKGARRGRSRTRRLGRGTLIALVLVAVGVGYGISRVDFGETIRDLTLPLQHEDIIRQQAEEKDVPADLIAAVINAESGFRPRTSHAGARGLMQIRPETARDIERRSGGETFVTEDLADPDLNIRYGTFHLRELLDLYDGNVVAALAAYNAGPSHASAWGGSELDVEEIPFPETRAYVERVLDQRRDYRNAYPSELGL